jgi:predicted phosphodiesterase
MVLLGVLAMFLYFRTVTNVNNPMLQPDENHPSSSGISATSQTTRVKDAVDGSDEQLHNKSSRRFRRFIAGSVVVMISTVVGVLLFGVNGAAIGPLRTEVRLVPATYGGTVVDLGPFGEVRFASHFGPVRADIEVRSMAPQTAGRLVSSETLEEIPDDVVADLRSALLTTAVKAVVGGAMTTTLIGFLLYRRRHVAVVLGTFSLVLGVSVVGTAAATYRPGSVLEPEYRGLVAAVPTLVGEIQDIAQNFDRYRNQLERLLTNVSELYTTGLELPSYAADEGTVTLLHVSDLHLNPAGVDLIRRLVTQFNVSVIVDSGDIADHGTSLEDPFLLTVGDLPVPYVYVRGNHDSARTQAVLASLPNVVVVDDAKIVNVAGLTFSGIGDPRFTPDKSVEVVADRVVRAAVTDLAARIAGRGVQIAVVHDTTAVEPLTGVVPLVLSGHTHQRSVTQLSSGTTLFVSGSTGGGGLRALTGKEPSPLEATVIHLNTKTGAVVAWDEITMGGVGLASVKFERHLAKSAPGGD